jgi:acetyl-CoA synthetase
MVDGRDVWYHEASAGVPDDPASCPCEVMDAEDLLFLMYTSGTTARPKGIVHTTGGYLVGVSTTHHYIFDIKPDTVYWCAADIGWIRSLGDTTTLADPAVVEEIRTRASAETPD